MSNGLTRAVITSLLAACLAIFSLQAAAVFRTWSGAGGDANWTTAGNWDVLPVAGDDLNFPNVALQKTNTNNFAAGTSFGAIAFTGGGYTITGNRITLTGNIGQVGASTFTNSLNTPLDLGAGARTVSFITSTADQVLSLGGVISGTGSLTMVGDPTFGGELTLSGANTYSGGTTLSGGHLIVGNNSAFGTGSVSAASNITIGLGGFTVANLASFGGSGFGGNAVVNGNGTWSGNISLVADTQVGGVSDSGGLNFTGVISGGFKLNAPENTADSIVRLSGNNTYTGTTTVFQGTLLVNGSQPGSNVVVNDNSTLGGSGTVGTVTLSAVGAHLAPGTSPGILSTGNLSIPSGSNLDIELNGTAAGSGYDQVNVTGTVSLGGTLHVTLGFVPLNGASFTIINNDAVDAVAGTFVGLAQGATLAVGGVTFQISYTGGTGNDVVLTVLSGGASSPSAAVPIPTLTPVLLGALALLLLVLARRRV